MNWPCDDMEPPPKDTRWKLNGAYTRPDPPKWMTVVAWIVIVAIILGGLWGVRAYAEEGEPLGTHQEWALHPSLGVVFEYRIDGQDVYYAHPIKAHGPVGECIGIMGKHENCVTFSIRGGAIMLMTTENETPWLYMVDIMPSAKRINGGDYERLIETTYRGCE